MECPYCRHDVEIANGRCPVCKERLYEVSEEDFEESEEAEALDVEDAILSRFRCAKCGGDDASVKEVAMTGAGLSKLFDIQHNHYLFVSCNHCGFVEVYDPEVLRGKKPGALDTVLDVLFGG
jgi:predicted nucleic-acid-binding Zn-ribbon protein